MRPTSTASPARRHRPGFTLIELLVSAVILIILGLLILAVISNASSITSRTTARLTANRVARECFDQIGRDLEGIRTAYRNANTFSATTNQGLQLAVNPDSVGARFRNPHAFFWQSALSRNHNHGDLAALGYFVLRDVQADPKDNRLQLRRLYVEPEDPANPPGSPEYLIFRQPTNWFPDELLTKFAPASSDADDAAGQRGWVADGVLAMWVRSLDPLGNPITTDAAGSSLGYRYDSRGAYRYTNNGVLTYPAGVKRTTPTAYAPAEAVPAFLEVGLVCVAPRDARLVTNVPTPAASDPTRFYEEIQQFTQAVQAQNPQVKSLESFTRKFRLYPGS